MNKLLTITSGLLATSAAFAEFSMPTLNVDAKVEFNSADVSEGRRLRDQNFAPSIEIGIPLLDGAGDLYVGLDSTLKTNSHKYGYNEIAPYVGFSYDVTDMFTLDLGYTFYRLDKKVNIDRVGGKAFAVMFDTTNFMLDKNGQSAGGNTDAIFIGGVPSPAPLPDGAALPNLLVRHHVEGKKQSHEIYAGIMADVLLSPALYFAYDFTQKKANLEGTIDYTFDLGSSGATGLAIDLGAKMGYSRVKKPYGIDRTTQVTFETLDAAGVHDDVETSASNLFAKKGWFYMGANADLVYSLNENTKARAGVEFSYNNAGKKSWINEMNHKKHNVWFSSAVEFSF